MADFVQHHLDDQIALADLAQAANLNQFYFLRSFKAATGKTPHQFLLEQRVERAKFLLQTTKLPLAEVALACGFNSQAHFSTQFRLQTGATPQRFRRLSSS